MENIDLNKSKILIADDKPDNIKTLLFLLKQVGYELLVAQNGEEVLKRIEYCIPDLILLDILMPDLDGFEVCKKIKQNEKTKDIPIIFMSALIDISDKIKGFELGAVDYITKPFQHEEILLRVASQLKINNLQKELKKINENLEFRINERTKALNEINKTLELQVFERTSQLKYLVEELENKIQKQKQIEKLLIKAKKEADNANKAKSEFLASMSHEIRTPLNGIIGMVELLLNSKLTQTQFDYIDSIKFASDNLLDIINDILNLSKIEAKKIEIKTQIFNLNEIIESILKSLTPLVYEKGIEIIYNFIGLVPLNIKGDVIHLRQILINLLGNAIKFTEKGEVVLNVENISKNSHNKIFLKFSICDTGIGIKKNKLKTIFEPFTQIHDMRTKAFSGTGLGLSISSDLVRLLGGEIWVESKENQGSTFYFTMSFDIVNDYLSEELFIVPDSLRNYEVLVIGNNQTLQKSFENIFTGWKMNHSFSGTIKEGYKIISKYLNENNKKFIILFNSDMKDRENIPKIFYKILARCIFISVDKHHEIMSKKYFSNYKSKIGKNSLPALNLKNISKPVLLSELRNTIIGLGKHSNQQIKIRSKNKISKTGKVLTVLIAEDNVLNQKVLINYLKLRHYNVINVEDGRKAVDVFRKRKIDLILLDIQMPILNGFETTKKIREIENTIGGHIPIIALTAHVIQSYKRKCIEYGMDDYISKPVKMNELFSKIDELFPNEDKNKNISTKKIKNNINSDILPIDIESVKVITGGIKKIYRDQINIYKKTIDSIMSDLRKSIEEKNMNEIFEKSHKLKGGLSSIGANNAAKIASEIQDLAKKSDLIKINRKYDLLFLEIDKINIFYQNKKEIDNFLNKL